MTLIGTGISQFGTMVKAAKMATKMAGAKPTVSSAIPFVTFDARSMTIGGHVTNSSAQLLLLFLLFRDSRPPSTDSAKMSTWLHRNVLAHIAANGGNIPKQLLD